MSSQARIDIIVAALDMASDELKDVQRNVKGVDQEGKKATKGLNDMEGQSKKTSKGLKRMGTAAKFAAVTGIAVLAGAAVKLAKSSVETASAVEEMSSKFDVVFGEQAPRAIEELEKFGDEVNRSRFDLMDMASTLQDTFVPLGFTRKAAADLSIEMTKLATDVASFNNASDTDVIRDFQSAIVGNHETVRKYGIVITEATLKQEAYESGIADLGSELSNAEKVQARLNLITEGTTDAHGDAAKTADSFANASKGLQASIKDLEVVIGEGLIPGLKELIKFSTTSIDNLVGLAKANENLNNVFEDSAQSAVATGMSYEEYNRSITRNQGAVGQLVFAIRGLTREEYEAIKATDAVTLASRREGEQLRAIKSAGLEAAEGLNAVDDAQPTLDMSQPLTALEDFTDAALATQAVNAALREAMETGGRITQGEMREIAMLAEDVGVELPENFRDMASNFNKEMQESGSVIQDELLDPTRELTEKEHIVRYTIEVEGDPIPGGGGGGGGGGGSSSATVPHGVTGPDVVGQHGLDFIVPPGFPNDDFTVGVTSGEEVNVTPQGESGRSLSIGTINIGEGGGSGRRVMDDLMRELSRWG